MVLEYNAEEVTVLIPERTRVIVRITKVEEREDKNGVPLLRISGSIVRPTAYEGEGFYALHGVNSKGKGPYYTGVRLLLEALEYDTSGKVRFASADWVGKFIGATLMKYEDYKGEKRARWGRYFHPSLFGDDTAVVDAEFEDIADAPLPTTEGEGPKGRGARRLVGK